MPILASDEIGSVADLVVDGDNGLLFPAGDVDALTAALRKLVAEPKLIETMGKRSLARIKDWNYDRCVAGLRAAVDKVAFVR